MKPYILILLATCAVKCDDPSYFIIQMPENDPPMREFNVYWNVPTKQCKSKKIPFDNLYEKYGIKQNINDSFLGNEISILYTDTTIGLFPGLLKDKSNGNMIYKNGGIPQNGSLDMHLEKFRSDLDKEIPDKDFSGVGIIDQEQWRPVFRQNYGTYLPQKNMSYELEQKNHPEWPRSLVETEAIKRFEKAAREFMLKTLLVAKEMRPNARWGYYAMPHCFNLACSKEVINENDRTQWLWSESTALYPSVYSSHTLSTQELSTMVRGRVQEAARLSRGEIPVLPYVRFQYSDVNQYLTENDLDTLLKTIYESDASGFIIWGSSKDVNSVDKCNKLQNYINSIFGPAVAKYSKIAVNEQDAAVDDEDNNTTEKDTTTIKPDDKPKTDTLDDNTNIDTNNIISRTDMKLTLDVNTTKIDKNNITTKTAMKLTFDFNTININTNYINVNTPIKPILDKTTNVDKKNIPSGTAAKPIKFNKINTNNVTTTTNKKPTVPIHAINIDANNITTRTSTKPILPVNATNIDANNINIRTSTKPTLPNTATNIHTNFISDTTAIKPTLPINATNIDTHNITTRTSTKPTLDNDKKIIDTNNMTNKSSNKAFDSNITIKVTNNLTTETAESALDNNVTNNTITRPNTIIHKVTLDTNNTTTVIKTILDEYVVRNTTIPDNFNHRDQQENDTQDLKRYVEDETLKTTSNNVSSNENVTNDTNTMYTKNSLLLKHLLNHTKSNENNAKHLPVSTESLATTKHSVEFETGTTSKSDYITKSNIEEVANKNKDNNIFTPYAYKMSTLSPNEYYSKATDEIYTKPTLTDEIYDISDNYV